MTKLEAGFAQLVNNPKFGKPRDNIRTGYRALQINRHVAYYRIQGQRIDIVRVLHGSMDAERHIET